MGLPRSDGRRPGGAPRPNVLFLTAYWPSEASPASGVFIREHAYAVSPFCNLAVVQLERAAGTSGLYDVVRVEGEELPVWRVPYRRFARPLSYGGFLLGALHAFRMLRRQGFEPDLVHLNAFHAAPASLVLGAVFRKPTVYTEHWTIFIPENPGRLSPAQRLVATLALRRAELVLPVSEDLRGELERLAPDARFRVIRNVVDERVFYPGPERPARPGEPWRLLTVGQLETPRKGIDVLLEAVAQLARERDDFRLEIVGEGADRSAHEQLAGRLGVDGLVTFHGWKAKPDVADLMRSSHLFVLASRYENNPCVIAEAMACGLPIVATRVGGVAEMVNERTGSLVERERPDALAQELNATLAGLSSFDREEISRRTLATYGRAPIGAAIAEAYAEALRKPGEDGAAPNPAGAEEQQPRA